jgi:hypothetical protein
VVEIAPLAVEHVAVGLIAFESAEQIHEAGLTEHVDRVLVVVGVEVPDDEPGDIQIVDSDTVRLRAERYSRDGRTYTIRAIVSGDGQVRYDTAEVRVPHSKRRSN